MKKDSITPRKGETFEQWFDRQGFRHFSADEFTSYFRRFRGKTRNSMPPRRLWAKLVPTLRVVDALRAQLGRPCVILSSYRSPAYNRAVGGASRSQHLQFGALDIAVSGVNPSKVFDILNHWRREGVFKGGLGIYSTFVHIDTRGYNATWGKR